MGILFTITMGIPFTTTMGKLFTTTMGIQFTISTDANLLMVSYSEAAISLLWLMPTVIFLSLFYIYTGIHLKPDWLWEWLHKDFILSLFSKNRAESIRGYRQFVSKETPEEISQTFDRGVNPSV